jgi:hypothetical protein
MGTPIQFANKGTSFLAIPMTVGALAISVVDASTYPTINTPDEFYFLVVEDLALTKFEVLKVTNAAGNVLTVERGQDGSTPQAFAAGARVENRVNKGALDQFRQGSNIDGGNASSIYLASQNIDGGSA